MWISPQITRGHLWKCSRIVPGAVLSIESKNGVRISKNKKCNFFAFYQNLEIIQTQAQDALNLLQSKSLLNRKVSVKSGDTGNTKFVQNFKREKILEKSLFWLEEEAGCSSTLKIPCIKVWISPQITGGHLWKWFRIVPGAVLSIESKNGVRISKNKKCIFFAFYQNLEIIQRGDPWDWKILKLCKVHQTCSTGGEHQKSKLGSVLEVFLHLFALWGSKKKAPTTDAKSRFWPATPSKVQDW